MLPYSIFDPGRTHCPGCQATQKELVEQCLFCGYTAAQCVSKFPYDPPPLERFLDPDKRLTEKDLRKASREIVRLEKRFPQISFYVCVAQLEKGVEVREFGYWLFNRSRPADESKPTAHTHGILFVLDRTSRRASLTIGCGLDPFIDDLQLERALAVTAPLFRVGYYGDGIAALARRLRDVLTERHTLARFAADKWKRLRSGGSRSNNGPAEVPEVTPGSETVVVARRDSVPMPIPAAKIPKPRDEEKHAVSR